MEQGSEYMQESEYRRFQATALAFIGNNEVKQ
jgi:hypothetical protein